MILRDILRRVKGINESARVVRHSNEIHSLNNHRDNWWHCGSIRLCGGPRLIISEESSGYPHSQKWTDGFESCQETKCGDRKFVKEVSDIRTSCPMIIKSPRERNTRPITISLVLSRVVQLRRGSMLFVSHQAPGPPPQPEAQFVRMFRSAERMALHLFQSSARILGAKRKTFATD